jgi:hypothetical protein
MNTLALPSGSSASESLSSRVAVHLAGVIGATVLSRDPFDHLVLEQPFAPELYPTLLANLPADTFYRELKHNDAMLPDGRSARLQFPLLRENTARLAAASRAFWNEVVAGLTSDQVLTAYKMKLGTALQSASGKKLASIRLRPYCTLFRDIGGYKISIHPDSPRKAITVQYYLPSDDSQLHLGTLFHTKAADGSYRQARAMQFAPNRGYAFAVTGASYHSVNPMRAQDRPRDSLMVIINHDRGPAIEGVKAAQKKLRALYDRLRGRNATEEGEGRYETM